MIKDGTTSAEIREHYPKITKEDLDVFLANEELEATKKNKEWGVNMKALNIGNHLLGCRGYDGKDPIWGKEDQASRELALRTRSTSTQTRR